MRAYRKVLGSLCPVSLLLMDSQPIEKKGEGHKLLKDFGYG